MTDISKREFFAVILLASRMSKVPEGHFVRDLFKMAINDADILIQTFAEVDDAKARKQRDEDEKRRVLKETEAKKFVLKGLKVDGT